MMYNDRIFEMDKSDWTREISGAGTTSIPAPLPPPFPSPPERGCGLTRVKWKGH